MSKGNLTNGVFDFVAISGAREGTSLLKPPHRSARSQFIPAPAVRRHVESRTECEPACRVAH